MNNSGLEIQVVRMLAMGPYLLVMLVGLVLAIRNLPRVPRSSWAVIVAIALSGLGSVGLPIAIQTLMEATGGWNNPSFNSSPHLMMLIYTVPSSLIAAVSWGLMFFAVFDRPPTPKFLVEDDPDRDILDK